MSIAIFSVTTVCICCISSAILIGFDPFSSFNLSAALLFVTDSGGFGSVQTGSYNGQTCAVKIYKDSMDPSYERERRIVTSGRLTHENVARYWAADSKDSE